MVEKVEGVAIGFDQPLVPEVPKLEGRPEEDLRKVEGFLKEITSYLEEQETVLFILRRDLAIRMNEMITSGATATRPVVGVANRIFHDTTTGATNFDDGTTWQTI